MTRPAVSIGQYAIAGRKARNDDSFGVVVPDGAQALTKGITMAIADGMSSSPGAKEASETCIRSFLDDYYCTHESWAVKTCVGRVLTAANRWLYSQGQALYADEGGMVTTFTGAVVKAGLAYVFHVGDSRLVLIHGGECEALTKSHRMTMTRGQDYLTRAVGMAPDLAVDFRQVPLADGDILVFTTDGVHDFLSDNAMMGLLGAHDDLGAAAKAIVEAAYNAGSDDNLTCQIVRVDRAGSADQAALHIRLAALPFPPELSPGMVFEGYRILREIHASKRSQVYLAEDVESSLRLVIKTPSVNYEDDHNYIRMFVREEWVGQLVSSPHVLRVLEPARPRRSLYTLSEYVEGVTLDRWMADNPRPSLETVRALITMLVKGLRALHRREILHQDLKPGNIIIDSAGVLKIIDYGSVRIAGLEELSKPEDLPKLVGTRDYIAPEYHTGEPITPQADLYSLGVIAYEMLTGKLPYGAGFATAREVRQKTYIPATTHNPDIPAWVDAALEKAVAKSLTKRFDALSAFEYDLAHPNPDFLTRKRKPLLGSETRENWRIAFAISVLLNAILAALLLMRR